MVFPGVFRYEEIISGFRSVLGFPVEGAAMQNFRKRILSNTKLRIGGK